MAKNRWKTPEFIAYFFIVGSVIIFTIPILLRMSSDTNSNFIIFRRYLKPGWIFGRLIDTSDMQYGTFRSSLLLLVVGMLAHLALSWLVRSFKREATDPRTITIWKTIQLVYSFAFLYILYGWGMLKITALLSLNYMLTKISGKTMLMPFLIWTSGLAMLFLNDHFSGYKFGWISNSLSFMDEKNGVISRWYVNFNFTLLRMISFSMDYYWAIKNPAKEKSEQVIKSTKPQGFNDRTRSETALDLTEYHYINYLTYCLYAPLLLAGPIVTFNNFISQINQPSSAISLRGTIKYLIRFIALWLLMEIMLHTVWVQAISKASAWTNLNALELTLFAVYNLFYVWLKLMIIWRFFRLWAMADGIETIENMTRCMFDSYSTIEFWRVWHRSYNRWVIRYIYLPLGGARYRIWNIWPIFTFVAIWHDIQFRLLVWGWLICLFMLPEIIGSYVVAPKLRKALKIPNQSPSSPTAETSSLRTGREDVFRSISASGYAFNLIMMCIANLVGFCVSWKDAGTVVQRALRNPLYDITLFIYSFSLAQIAMEIRAREAAQKASELKTRLR